MANVRNANTYFIDTASTGGPPATTNILDVKNIKVMAAILSATGANAVAVMVDNSSAQAPKLPLRLASNNETQHFLFDDNPVVFPNGIAITTLTNCVVTLIVRESQA